MQRTRVGIIGHGAIGRVVASRLRAGDVPSAQLVGLTTRQAVRDPPVTQVEFDQLVDMSQVIVEAAGHQVVRDHGVETLERGLDLVLVSLGAMADPEVEAAIRSAGPGRAVMCTGAVGGIDVLRAAHRLAPLDRVQLTTTKRPSALIQPWMPDELVAELQAGVSVTVVFEGTAREAAISFPKSINVAASIALALESWDLVDVRIVADPNTRSTRHVIEAEGAAGHYRFEIANRPSKLNPATSEVVPYAVLQALSDLCAAPALLR